MGRICIVQGCDSIDNKVLAHRFPKNRERAEIWRDALQLDISLDVLIEKYVVCHLHFISTDYRNALSKFLNVTAVPRLNVNPAKYFIVLDEDGRKMAFDTSSNLEPNKEIAAAVDSDSEETEPPVKKQKITYDQEEYDIEFVEEVSEKDIEIHVPDDPEFFLTNYSNAITQTDPIEESAPIEEIDPQFSDHPLMRLSKTDLVEKLIESQQKVEELEKAIEKHKTIKKQMLKTIENLSNLD